MGRVAGPYDQVPFDNFIQSPIGLVPKAGEQKTRLIFHLSYNFSDQEPSLNQSTPKEYCSVKYRDIDYAVQAILKLHDSQDNKADPEGAPGDYGDEYVPVVVYSGKTDAQSAFRLVPLNPNCWAWLIMKAENPGTGKIQYFVDKCLPFGASISCALFQRVSDAIRHIAQYKTGSDITNYLDDFYFIALTIWRCNQLIKQFLDICEKVGFPISDEKTVWAAEIQTFLGILLNGRNYVLSIPIEKKERAEHLLRKMIDKNKATVQDLQSLCGYLNFLGRAIHPGRVFTRRMYSKFGHIVHSQPNGSAVIKYTPMPYHHIKLDKEFKLDCKVWLEFITDENLQSVVCRPMIDLTNSVSAEELKFYSDASAAKTLGFGCSFGNSWIFGQWEDGYIDKFKPSIEYLELYALVAGILTWQDDPRLNNCRVIVFCDNQAVVHMINNITSGCKNCMHLLRIMVLNGLRHNQRVFVKFVSTKNNFLADSLSRLKIDKFKKLLPSANVYPDKVHPDIWPPSKIWQHFN